LMTFVENVFKHGIDKISGKNKIYISLQEEDNHLVFQTKNLLSTHRSTSQHGLGLKNLRQRLTILYGNNFDMQTAEDNECFVASLKFPVA
jgi:LytS/YehU family sensor histidine kinase